MLPYETVWRPEYWMALKIVSPGELRHRVTIQFRRDVQDSTGGRDRDLLWQSVDTVWAKVEPLRGTEYMIAMQTQNQLTHKVTIRYRSDVLDGMRFLFGARNLSIVGPGKNLEERDRWLEFMCSEEA